MATRRKSALANVALKRAPKAYDVDLKALVRVYLLDGSSKVLQMNNSRLVYDHFNMRVKINIKDILFQ